MAMVKWKFPHGKALHKNSGREARPAVWDMLELGRSAYFKEGKGSPVVAAHRSH